MESKVSYFKAGENPLSVECYFPQNPSGKAHVFYYGGGWMEDNRHRFRRYACDLAKRGITVFLPQYRVYGLHGVSPREGLEDVMDGLRYLEGLYPEYGIQSRNLSWGGGSAGAQLILTAVLVKQYRERLRLLPSKLVLFNPVCCPHSLAAWVKEQIGHGFDFEGICPLCNMENEIVQRPQILAMHGTEDEIAPFEDLEALKKAYCRLGEDCRILPFEGRRHGFHHPESSREDYRRTLKETLIFLLGEEKK